MLLAELTEVSRAVAATRARLAKIETLAGALRSAQTGEVPIAVAYLSGELPQRQIGVGWAALRDAPPAAAEPSLTLTDVDEAFTRIGALAGKGSAGERRQLISDLMGEATADEQHLLVRLLSGGHLGVTLAHPGALRGVLAAGFYLAVMAWVGLGLGAVIRHTAGAITAMIGVVFLLPHVIQALPAPWDVRIGKYSLDIAAQQVIAQHPAAGYFPPGPSLLIVAGYAAAAIAAAALLVTRRDA